MKRVTELTAPSMINSVFFNKLFWQHRAGPEFNVTNAGGGPLPGFADFAAPEALVAFPPVSPTEMGHDNIGWASGDIQFKLAKSEILRLATPSTVPPDIAWLQGQRYDDIFGWLYGSHPSGNPVTRERVSMSIAHYLRTLISDRAPVFIPGELSEEEHHAFELMDINGRFRCHSSTGSPQFAPGGGFVDKFDSLFSDGELYSISLPPPGDQAIDPITGLLGPAEMARFGLSMNAAGSFFGGHIGPAINWSPIIGVQPDRMATWSEATMPLLGATGIIGGTVFGQWVIWDGSAPSGYATTRAARYLMQ